MPFTVAIEYKLNISSSNDDEEILCKYIEGVFNFNGNHRISLRKLSDYAFDDIDYILLQEILESPLRAGDYFLNDMKSEQIFHGAWDCITDDIIHGCNRGLCMLLDTISPMGFKYLLKRIKPSLYFKAFLQEFAQDFEYCFSILWNTRYPGCIIVKDDVQSLMTTIHNFLKDCEVIENGKVSENEHYYTHQITHFGAHKFKNELDASYEMAIKHFCNSENDQMPL
ncbi:hypothetical protein BDQ17DRAFT_1373348 [Cyathus striatus]|nr:hypothetical protein BDQ17DRAFT_1373348 [Cyathus striatus]